MKSQKVLKPGQPGTKKWVEKYGDSLYYVRHRYESESNRKIVTVELIVEEKYHQVNSNKTPANKIMYLRIGFSEKYLRKLVKESGGRWNARKNAWELSYGQIKSMGLEERIIPDI